MKPTNTPHSLINLASFSIVFIFLSCGGVGFKKCFVKRTKNLKKLLLTKYTNNEYYTNASCLNCWIYNLHSNVMKTKPFYKRNKYDSEREINIHIFFLLSFPIIIVIFNEELRWKMLVYRLSSLYDDILYEEVIICS